MEATEEMLSFFLGVLARWAGTFFEYRWFNSGELETFQWGVLELVVGNE
jgi:hypothetical protein